jgi:DNA-binding transcriptional ArsR family regulator
MQLEEVFSSKARMKILKLTLRIGMLNVSEIARRTGLNYATTDQHLKVLEGEGILQQKVYGRIRMYKYNESSAKAKAVQNLIETWEQAGSSSEEVSKRQKYGNG